jgi:two-component system NarL family sensor kinase
VLQLLSAPLAVAAHATTLSEDVQRSREDIVTARAEERRRLRRDLHDGLGPTHTGMAFQADAARNNVRSDPARAEQLISTLRDEAAAALDDVRRLVYALHPPSLDELGLRGALAQRVDHLNSPHLPIVLHCPEPPPELPPAVEVAGYRIVVEALTNAVRHAGASRVDVRLDFADGLLITVTDDGPGTGDWRPGVGLTSMLERATEIGGTVHAGRTPNGGRVSARLPLPLHNPAQHPTPWPTMLRASIAEPTS